MFTFMNLQKHTHLKLTKVGYQKKRSFIIRCHCPTWKEKRISMLNDHNIVLKTTQFNKLMSFAKSK